MGRERGWVSVSVQTYQSQRNSSQRILQQDYTVDESGATLNALARNSEGRDLEENGEQAGQAGSTSILLRDWKLSGRRAYIRFDKEDNNFWFSPVVDENRATSSTPGFPCSRGDVFLKLGMRGARIIPWRLQEGDIFRLGQAYVLVSKIRFEDDAQTHAQLLQEAAVPDCEVEEADTDVEEDEPDPDSRRPQCYICYESGCKGNPLLNLCQCAGTVKFVHLQCLQRWMQPEGSSAVNTHCPICKAKYPESAQAMMISSPAIMLESWSNHRTLKLRHWISFNRHSTAALGRFSEHNDVSIPDHSVSGEHAFIIHQNGQFWLHDRDSSNGTFIRLRAPLKLTFGEPLQMKMGKSLLSLQAKRTRWSRIRHKLLSLSFSGDTRNDTDPDRAERMDRERVSDLAERASLESLGIQSNFTSFEDFPGPPTRERSRVLTVAMDE